MNRDEAGSSIQLHRWLLAPLLSTALIALIAAFTNSLDTQKFYWDFIYYIAMARDGLGGTLASPFAYRYVTPLLAYLLTHSFDVSIHQVFLDIAYLGAFLQLTGVFWFTHWFTRSIKGAYFAMLATAFSLYNVKFLLFDVYRPDHLAYAVILLQTYLAFREKFTPLLITTVLGVQLREFSVLPMVAYLAAFAFRKDRPTFLREAIVSALGVGMAVALPRLLIPVSENFDFASLSPIGLLRMAIAPLVWQRDFNFIYATFAFCLPLLMLARPASIKSAWLGLSPEIRTYLTVYGVLVLIFSFLGGTDFGRFSTYLFLPEIILLAIVAGTAPIWNLAATLAATFLFNQIWLPIPNTDYNSYLDFYGAFSTRFSWSSVLHLLEFLALLALGFAMRSPGPAHRSGESRPAGG
jgi:hypothetical protein